MSESSATVPRPGSSTPSPSGSTSATCASPTAARVSGSRRSFCTAPAVTRMWLPFYEQMAASVDLVAPEHPGFGETQAPEWRDGLRRPRPPLPRLRRRAGSRPLPPRGLLGRRLDRRECRGLLPGRVKSLTLITPAGLYVPGKPLVDLFAMPPERIADLPLQRPEAEYLDYLPDGTNLDDIVHAYGEMTSFASLTWAPHHDPKLPRRLARVQVPDASRRRGGRLDRPERARRQVRGARAGARSVERHPGDRARPDHARARTGSAGDRLLHPRRAPDEQAALLHDQLHALPVRPAARGARIGLGELPNSHYDPMFGHRLYTDYLEEEIATERFGYDGVLVNEHHQNAYGTMPNPNLIASYIVAADEPDPDRHHRQRPQPARPPAAGGRGRGDARRDLRRAHRLRLRARHGDGVLLLRREPDLRAREVLGGARPDPQGLDGARAVRVGGRALPPPLRQPLATAPAAAASADLATRCRLARDNRRGSQAALHVHAGLRPALALVKALLMLPPDRRGEVRATRPRPTSSARRSRPTSPRRTSRHTGRLGPT